MWEGHEIMIVNEIFHFSNKMVKNIFTIIFAMKQISVTIETPMD